MYFICIADTILMFYEEIVYFCKNGNVKDLKGNKVSPSCY